MILDTIENLPRYTALNPLFSKVVDYLAHTDLKAQSEGKVAIEGDDLFVNYSLAQGKSRETARLESHDRMIDIQIPLSGAETMGYTPRTHLPVQPYDTEKDITFYDGEAEHYITVHPGEFAIFFPQDGHAPCVSEAPKIQKVIFKVKA